MKIGARIGGKTKISKCPRCGFEFDVSYARMFACRGCKYSVFGNCGYIRCPKCGYEYPQDFISPL